MRFMAEMREERRSMMVESKGWQWEMVKEDENSIWKNPCIESYSLLNRWKMAGKMDFLDLGCGLGRHSMLFGRNGFHVRCFDISREALARTRDRNMRCRIFTRTMRW